jgi:hypothetical protein
VVNGEIVMVESEGEKIWCGVKRPSTCMHDVEQSGLSERPASNSRARLTESGGWAHSQGATKHDHGGEYYNSGSMARAEGYSSAGFHHGGNSSRNMAFGTGGTGRLHRLEFGGKGLEVPSLAQFKHPPPPPLPCNSRNSGGHSSSSLQTMNPVSSGASLRMTMNPSSSMTMMCRTSPATLSAASFHSKGLVTPDADLGASLGTAPFSRTAGEDHSHDHDLYRRHRHKRSSATSFDREITNFESQIAQTAAENIMRLQPAHSLSRPPEDAAAAAAVHEEQKDMVEEMRSGSGELSLGLHAHPPSSDTKVAGTNSSGKGLCSDSSMPFVDLSLGTKSLANSGGDDVKVG